MSADRARYEALQAWLFGLLTAGMEDSEEFTRVWAELEQIKNRHGGVPPAKISTETNNPPDNPAKPKGHQ